MNQPSEQLEEIFQQSIEITSSSQRQRFIDERCAGDPLLKRDVELLVANYFRIGRFLESPPWSAQATAVLPAAEDAIGARIGAYRLLERIGEGGMGVVYVAEQELPVCRRVALKIIKPGMDSREVIARFSAERQALALMDHPHIAKIHDAGTTQAGRPFFVMELVKGIPITAHCDQRRLTTRERLQLFVKVCQAIQHAHQKGIIHRDIKPSNVLVTMHDDVAVPKVIDFGIAKAVNQSLGDERIYTRFSQLLGTPLYMSPEQAEMNALDVDTRSDVYSLGALLYELLTGHTLFDCEGIHKAGIDELRRMIREHEPLPPSRLVSTLDARAASTASQNRGVDHRHLNSLLRRELDWIVMKAIEKDRTRRYESAGALAADVRRYLSHEPVEACPPSVTYRLRKFARRHRVFLLTAGLIALALLLGTSVSLWQAREAQTARKAAEQQRKRVDEHFELAHEAVFQLVARLALEPRLQQSDFHELRRDMLTRVAQFYDRLATDRQNDLSLLSGQANAHGLLANLQSEMGDHAAARISRERKLTIFSRLAELNHSYLSNAAESHNELGATYLKLQDARQAEAEFRSAVSLLHTLASKYPQEPKHRTALALVYSNLGVLLSQGQRFTEAASAFEAAIQHGEELTRQFPNDTQHARALANARMNLAQLLMEQGQPQQAQVACENALAVWQKLFGQLAGSAAAKEEKARTHILHARILMVLNRDPAAEAEFLKALDLISPLSQSFPRVPVYQLLTGQCHFNLGKIAARAEQLADALEHYRTAVQLFTSLASSFPEVAAYREALVETHTVLAACLMEQEKFGEARAYHQESITIGERLTRDFPAVASYSAALAANYYNFGNCLSSLGDYAEAVEAYRRAIELFGTSHRESPELQHQRLRDAHSARAEALVALQRHAEALADWEQAFQFDSGEQHLWLRVARVYCLLRVEPGRAEEEMLQLLELINNGREATITPVACYDLACAFAVRAGQKVDDMERNWFAERAVLLLRQASVLDFFSSKEALARLHQDADLNAIRERPDFVQLIGELPIEAAQ